MSLGDVLGGFISGHGSANNLASQGRAAITSGYIAQQNAYQRATQQEFNAKQRSIIAAMNMERMAKNRTAQMDAALAAQGGSGFTAQDSGSFNERQASRKALQQMADLGMSAAIEDSNLRFDAVLSRMGGDRQLRVAQNEADYYRRMARITRRTTNINAIAGATMEVGEMAFGNF